MKKTILALIFLTSISIADQTKQIEFQESEYTIIQKLIIEQEIATRNSRIIIDDTCDEERPTGRNGSQNRVEEEGTGGNCIVGHN